MKHIFYALSLILSTINLSYANSSYDWPHEISDLAPNPKIVHGKLKNGFRYVFMPNDNLPKHFAIRLYIKAGSYMEEDHERGLAHFLEHIAFKGIKGYPEDEIIQTLQRLGVPFGSHTNAHTGVDETVYKFDFMDNTLENLEHGLKIMAGIADGMFLDEALITKEIDVILAEKHVREGVSAKLGRDYRKYIYKGHRVNDRLPIGIESVINSANPTLLRNFYKKWYRPERMILVVVGDLDRNEVESRINEYFSIFSNLLEAPNEPDLGTVNYNRELQSRIYKDKELSLTQVSLISVKPPEKKIDNTLSRKEILYKSIANQIFNQRMQKIAEQEIFPFTHAALSNSINFSLKTSTIWAQCKPEQVLEALSSIENELRRVFEFGFTDEEFDRALRQELYNYKSNLPLDESSQTSDLIKILLAEIINERVLTPYKTDYEIAKEFCKNEANKNDCLQVFKDSWDMNNLSIYLLTNSDIKYTKEQLNETYLKSKEIILEAPEEQEIVKYSFDKLSEPATILREEYNDTHDCYQYKLSNNVRVNLKQTNYDKDKILYKINFGHGKDEPGTKPVGIIPKTPNTLYDGGIGQLSQNELIRAFTGSGVEIPDMDVNHDTFTISSSIEPDDFESQMNLLCGFFMEPAYRSDKLKQRHLNIENYYKNLNQTIDGISRLEVYPYLSNYHYDYLLYSPDDLTARTPEEVKNWMTNPLTQSYIEITIVGDFDKDQVLDTLSKTLGALPKRHDHKQCYEPRYGVSLPKPPLKQVFSYYSDLPHATSTVYWELPDYDSDDPHQSDIDTARAIVLSEILKERLRQIIRMELGEGYSPSTGIEFQSKAITATTVTNSEKANYLCDLITMIAENLANEGATEDEFNRVILAKLLNIESNKSTNHYWLNRLGKSQQYAHLDKDADFMDNYYKKLTLNEVNEAAKEFLKSEKALKVMVVPDEHRKKVEKIAYAMI